jgi:hypothetical protein
MMFFCFLLLQRLLSSISFKHQLMNPEMNDNNRKNYSKTIAMAGMGFLLIATAFTFSFANSGQQLVNAQQGGNATRTIVATPHDTFTANGKITATIQEQGGGGGGGNQTAGGGGNQTAGGGGNQTGAATGGTTTGGQEPPYILGGDWNINIESGNLTEFAANFIMVHTDGTGYHTHDITGFNAGNATITWIPGQQLLINGTADIAVNGTTQWPGVNTNLTFTENPTVLTIMTEAEATNNHFQGQPIYGVVSQATGENGTMIIKPPQAGGEGGEQQGGGPLEGTPLEPLQDLFGGGGQ